MNSDAILVLYVILALIGAGILSLRSKSSHKILTFLIAFWILGASVIRQDIFVLNLKMLGGDLQIKRAIFLIFSGYFVFVSLIKFREHEILEKLRYEKYLYFFCGWFLIVLVFHSLSGVLEVKELVVVLQAVLSVVVLYLVLKRDADSDMIRVFSKSFIIVAVISSIVAIIQFFIDPFFLRIGTDYLAFGGKLRSTGVYWSEYMHSYTLVVAIVLALIAVRSKRLKKILIGLFVIGIVLSFHRMSWIITFIVITLYLIIEKRQSIWKHVIISSVLLFTFFVITTAIIPVMDDFTRSDLYQSRLSSDTITNRLKFFNMVLERMDKIFLWGAGSTSSILYYHGMMSTGVVGTEWALGEAGSIHNLYLELLFFYGLPLLIFFCLMLFSMLREYLRLYFKHKCIYLFPFLFLIIYCLMNLTNSFPFKGDFGFLFGIVIGCTAAISSKRLFLPSNANIGNS